jgi:hypothetical protein
MPFTAQNLCDEALRLNAMLAPGRQASAAHYQVVLDALNQVVDSLATDGQTIYQLTFDNLPLTGVNEYLIGTGATSIGGKGVFNTVRPQKIRAAAVVNGDGQMACTIVSPEKWATIVDGYATGAFAEYLACDYDFPLATIYLWPVPPDGESLQMWSYKPLTGFASLTTAVNFPPGYTEVLKYLTALAVYPELPGARLDPAVPAKAQALKASLGQLNAVTIGSPVPPAAPLPIQRPLTEMDIEKGTSGP